MAGEYLVFNAVVLVGPLLFGRWEPTSFRGRWRAALAAAATVAVPFVIWDVLATGRYWTFNGAHTWRRVLGLPLGEWAFFVTVPLACLFTWEMLSGGVDRTPVRRGGAVRGVVVAALIAAAAAWAAGREYTALAAGALAAALALDLAGGGPVVRHRRFGLFALLVLAFTAIFNGYLTWRPLVLYDPHHQLDLRIGTIPIEDFAYGLALVIANVALFERLRDRLGAPRTAPGDTVGRRLVRARLGGYRRQVNVVCGNAPLRKDGLPRVAVVGGGLAGLRAATVLGARGFPVTLFEAAPHLGGKVGAWPHRLADGTAVEVEHGFHAFFRHYYNLRRFLDEVGATPHMRPIADYRILARDGASYGFAGLETAPLLNVLAMLRTPMLRPRDLLRRPRLARLMALLTYDPERTFARLDDVSFEDFADRADLPPALRLVFTTFARAFFATPDRMSAAEVVKSFHFFYLSHDHGLLYDHPDDTYGRTVLAPIQARLEEGGVRVRTGAPVEIVAAGGDGFRVVGEAAERLVLAPDVVGAREIACASPDLRRIAPAAMERVERLRPSQPNVVLRLWIDRPSPPDLPGFVITERHRLLDAVTFYDRVEQASAAWAARTGGGVLELHCYAVPDGTDEARLAALLTEDLFDVFPELRGCGVVGEHLQVNRRFTAFHVGMHAARPGVRTEDPRLVLAGDWVALPVPAMLMEAAATSGLLAANAILAGEGLREEPVYSVPARGVLAR